MNIIVILQIPELKKMTFKFFLSTFESSHIAELNYRIAMSLRNTYSETGLYSLFQISSSNIFLHV